MGRSRKQRRQPHGSTWHWKQTDCWYYTQPGTKKRVPLFDESGQRIRGKDKQQIAELALARMKVASQSDPGGAPSNREAWLVAEVCSKYLQHCERGVANLLKGLKKPPANPRLQSFSNEDEQALYGAIEEAFFRVHDCRRCGKRFTDYPPFRLAAEVPLGEAAGDAGAGDAGAGGRPAL